MYDFLCSWYMHETHIWSFRGLEEVQGWRFLHGGTWGCSPNQLVLVPVSDDPQKTRSWVQFHESKRQEAQRKSETCDQNRKNDSTFWTKKMESAQSQDLLLLQEPPGSSRGRRASNMESMEHWITWWLANPMPRPKPVGIHPPFVCLSNCGGTGQGIQRQAPNCNCISALRTTCGGFGNTPGHKLALWKVASRAELRKSYMHLHAMHGIIF